MNLDDMKITMAMLKEGAVKPHPATAKECREHNRIVVESGRPGLRIKPGDIVFSAEDLRSK